jgi:hypothetical protein
MDNSLRERLALIETKARTLARSGKYGRFDEIEMALLALGYRESRRVFANRWTQAEVTRICEEAQRLKSEPAALPLAVVTRADGLRRNAEIREPLA